LYQLFILRTPGHAAVFETVALASPRRRSLINGVLRTALRRFAELENAAAAAPLATRLSHPEFIVTRWETLFGEQAATAQCDWDNQPTPIYARVNTLKTSTARFVAEHPTAEPLPAIPGFAKLASVPHDSLTRGECYIQDPSTRVACEMLAPQAGDSVLDACAAPGGKTGYLAQMMENRGELVAADRDTARLQTLRDNLQRLGIAISRTLRHDWRSGPLAVDDPPTFDKILIDAPCTNTGVMRRRVDVRWRLTPADFARMQSEQIQIITAALSHLRPGGVVVYSTCSIEPEENEAVIEQTVARFPFLRCDEQKSIVPFRDGFDGAFAARLTRTE
jgi:16S rRNA (cytosine967-C5)-methyltransferase